MARIIRSKVFPVVVALTLMLAIVPQGMPAAVNASAPFEHKVTNVNDVSFTVSWVTADDEIGYVEYGITQDLGSFAYDERDTADPTASPPEPATFSDSTHHVKVDGGLTPGTPYYYKIVSGGVTYDNNGVPYEITTGPIIETIPPPTDIGGFVFKPNGTTPAEGAIVYITVIRGPATSQELSTLISSGGDYVVVIGGIRTDDYQQLFNPVDTDQLSLFAQGDPDEEGIDFELTTVEIAKIQAPDLILQLPGAPEITTNAASGITTDSATLNGYLNSLGDYTSVDLSFEWGTESGVYPNNPAATPSPRTTIGSFSAAISGLDSNTPYYFRAKAVTNGRTVYGLEETFTTEKVMPTVTTDSATDVGTNSATLNMTYDFKDYGSGRVRFAYRESGGTWEYTSWVAKSGSGSYAETITGLAGHATYDFKAHLEYDTAVMEGNVRQFQTGNTPPTAPLVDVTPDQPVTGDDLACTVTTPSTDADDDTITYTYQWYKDEVLQAGETTTTTALSDTVSSALTARGEIWKCVVTPNDGYTDGPTAEDQVTIGNTPPTAPVVDVTPDQPVTGDDLACTVTTESTDDDGDTVTYTYQWYKDGVLQSDETTTTTALSDTVSSALTAKGETWRCVVTPNDSYIDGQTAEDQVTIGNTPPTAPVVDVTPDTPLTGDDLVGTVTTESTDDDGDTVTYTYQWYKNGVLQSDETTTTTALSDTVSSALTAKGETWRCVVTPNDGTDDGPTDEDQVTIGNTPPTAPVVDVTPDQPVTGDDLVGTVTTESTDDDGDTVTYTYQWYKDDVLQPDETTTTTELSDTVSSALTAEGETWRCVVTPNDGTDDGATAQDEVTVLGVPVVEITSPEDRHVTNQASLTVEGTIISLPSAPVLKAWLTLNDGEPVDLMPLTDGSFSQGITLVEGPNTILVEATNLKGTGSDEILVYLDTTPPVVEGLIDDNIPTKSKTWKWFSYEAATYRYAIDQDPSGVPTGDYRDETTTSIGPGEGIDGTYYIHVQAKDKAGNESAVRTVSAILDNTPPTAELSNLPTDPTNETTAEITVGGEDVVFYKYSLDNPNRYSDRLPVKTPITLAGLSEGKHTLYVIGRDTAGNWQSKELIASPTISTWTVDTTAPVVAITSPEDGLITNQASQTVAGTIDDLTIGVATLTVDGADTPIDVDAGTFSHGVVLGAESVTVHTISVSATDAAGNTGTSPEITVILDPDNPVVTITSPYDGFVTNTESLTVTGFINEEMDIAEATLTLNGGAPEALTLTDGLFSHEVTLIEGANTIQVSATDAAGNTGTSAEITVTLDLEAPTAVLTGAPTGIVSSTEAEITVSGEGITHYKYKLDDGSYSETEIDVSEPISLTDLTDDMHTLYVIGKDTAENWQELTSPTTATWKVDTVNPVVAITSPADALVTNRASQTVTGTVTDDSPIVSATLTLNDGEPQPLRLHSAFNLDIELEEGANTILVSATDAAGNVGTDTITVTLNTAPPSLTSPTNGTSTTDPTPAFNWEDIAGAAAYHIQIATGFMENLQEDDSLTDSTYMATTLTDGNWYWHVRWQDAQGNWSNWSATWSFTVSTVKPTVAITSPGDGDSFTTASQTVTGTVAPATGITSATLTLNGVSRTIPVTGGAFSKTVTLVKGENTIEVIASNIVGTGTSGTITVTYVTKPKVTITSPADDSIFATPTQTITGIVEGLNITSTVLNLNGIDQVPEVTLTDGSFTYDVLLAEGANTVYVRATNAAGTGISLTIIINLDTDAPTITITSQAQGDVTNEPAQTVTGTIDDTDITEATLILNGVVQASPVPVTDGTFTVILGTEDYPETLTEGTNTIEIVATDASGNEGSSGAITVILDTRPPVISITSPANDSITNDTAQTITGTITDKSDITAATLTLNGGAAVNLLPLAAGSFSQGVTLAENQSNTIVISATDAAGNTGSTSIVITHDAVKPVVTITSPSSGQTTGNASVTVTGTISDINIEEATLTLNGVDQTITVTPDIPNAQGIFGQDITLSPGANTIEVTATDGVNEGSSGIITVTLDTTPPEVIITSPTEDALLGTTDITITGTIDDLSVTSATLTLNGEDSEIPVEEGAFSVDVTLRAASVTTNTVEVSAEDAYGNRGTSGTLVVEVDVDRPVVIITTPSSGLSTNVSHLAVSGTVVDDPPITEATISVNGKSKTIAVSDNEFGTTITLAKGSNAIIVTATDGVNTGSSGVITVTYDKEAPKIKITSPAPGVSKNTPQLVVSGTVDDPNVTTVTLSLTKGAAEPETQVVPVQAGSFSRVVNLQEGPNKIEVSATDEAGNTGTAKVENVYLDTEAPLVTITSPENNSLTNTASLTVEGTVVDTPPVTEATLTVTKGTAQPEEYVIPVTDGNFTYDITLAQGLNYIKVTATDGVNTGSSGIVTVELDNIAPTLIIGLSDPTDTILITVTSEYEALQGLPTVSISGTTTGGVTVAEDVVMALVDVNKWTGTYPVEGILPGGTYNITVTGTDEAGNTATNTATFAKEAVTIGADETQTVETDTTTLEIDTTGDVEDASVSVTQHLENPAENVDNPTTAPLQAGAFVEIIASGTLRDNIEEIEICVVYDDAEIAALGIDEGSLTLYVWNVTTGEWDKVTSTVDPEANTICATVTSLSKYGVFGQQKEEEREEVIVAAPPLGTTDVSTVVTYAGEFRSEVEALSEDEACKLTIAAGTIGLKPDGRRLSEITMVEMEEAPAPPADSSIIGLVYDFGPDDATFDPPATLTISYDPAEIPEGISEENLVIAFWDADAGEWVMLEDCIVDPVAHAVSAPVSHFTPFAILTVAVEEVEKAPPAPPAPPKPTLAAATFTTSTLSISPAAVNVGDTVTISVLVSNTGDLQGTYTVTLKIDGALVSTEDVTLAGGASQTVTFTTSVDTAGSYTVSIDDLSGTFTVREVPPPAPAAFATSTLSITPAEAELGDTVTISVLVSNTGDLQGTYTVTLKIDGALVSTEDVTLAGGASQTVTFTTSMDTAGSYTVSIDDLSGTFTVREVPPPAAAVNWGLIGGIIGGVVVVILLVTWLVLWRRRAY